MGTAAFAVYKFGRFTLHLGRGAFLVDGVEHSLRPKSFALLQLFVENPGRLIDRDEIMSVVWPGIFVTDDSIAQCISEIRRALGDNDQRLLRTLPRRGYRFIASVIAEPDKAAWHRCRRPTLRRRCGSTRCELPCRHRGMMPNAAKSLRCLVS